MKLQRSWVPALVVAVISLASGGWLLQQSVEQGEGVFEKGRLFEEVHRLVAERYVDETSPADLYQMAINGMLRELGDPYTSMLTPEEWENLQLSTTGNYGGLGIRIESKDSWITVVGVLPNTPAERRGLATGDRIIEVEGESAEGWSTTKAVQVLRGPQGSEVTITVARVGVDRPLRFTIEREDIHVEAVQAFLLDERVGYVKLDPFSREARREVRRAIDGLLEQGAASIVLDLRENPGGLLEEGIAVADLFLPQGAEVVATRSRLTDQNQVYRAPSGEAYQDLPLVVMVNDFSASASEIVAGALQDHDRALIVGTPTFGKGSVQTLYGLSGGNHLKVTTAKWYTPTGRSIQKDHGEEGRLSEVIAQAVSMDGEPVATRVDTTEREAYRTERGRVVYGGGGITPDLIVMPDTLTTREQLFRSTIVTSGVSLTDAAFRFGVRWSQDRPDLRSDFQVTPAMRRAFFEQLRETGVEVDRELYEEASGFVDFLLGREIANAAFGETARLRFSLGRDLQVGRALALLRSADSPEALFALAQAEAGRSEPPSP